MSVQIRKSILEFAVNIYCCQIIGDKNPTRYPKVTCSGREARRAHQSHCQTTAAECLHLYLYRNTLGHGHYMGMTPNFEV